MTIALSRKGDSLWRVALLQLDTGLAVARRIINEVNGTNIMHVDHNDIRGSIFSYINLIEGGSVVPESNLQVLEVALDSLALSYRFATLEINKDDFSEAPSADYQYLRRLAAERFPQLGFYNMPNLITSSIAEAEVLVCDALDDVADIAVELYEVAWRWDNTSSSDALWHFRFGYESHWGDHLRYLQLYIHALKKEA